MCQSTVKWQLTKKLGLGAEGGKFFFLRQMETIVYEGYLSGQD